MEGLVRRGIDEPERAQVERARLAGAAERRVERGEPKHDADPRRAAIVGIPRAGARRPPVRARGLVVAHRGHRSAGFVGDETAGLLRAPRFGYTVGPMSQGASDLIGRTLGGRFRITSFLGEGAMASVFRAEQDADPKDVAVKVMHRELLRDVTFAKRFVR